MTFISWSSDFALYLYDYLMEKCHILDISSMWHKSDLKIWLGQCDLISWSSDYASYLEDCLIEICHTLDIIVSCDTKNDL